MGLLPEDKLITGILKFGTAIIEKEKKKSMFSNKKSKIEDHKNNKGKFRKILYFNFGAGKTFLSMT